MLTALLILGGICAWLPIHAYGMGRYERARRRREPFDPEKVEHKTFCNLARNSDGSFRYDTLVKRGCSAECVTEAQKKYELEKITSGRLVWPIAWPLEAAYHAGKTGGKPIITYSPEELEKAFDVLDQYLGEK